MRISKEKVLQKYDEISKGITNSSNVKKTNTPLFKKYQIGNAGTTNVNLLDGTFFHELNLCSIKENALELAINQIFDSKLFNKSGLENNDKFMGKGWKTNFHQRLIKPTVLNEETYSLDTTYIDGQGNSHVFKEKWYYEINGTKYYIKKDQVYLDDDQKLKYYVNENLSCDVNYEVENSDNLKLISPSSIYNYNKLKAKRKKKYYITLQDGVKKYVYVNNNKALIPLYYVDANPYVDGIEFAEYQDLCYSEDGILYKKDKDIKALNLKYLRLTLQEDEQGQTYVQYFDNVYHQGNVTITLSYDDEPKSNKLSNNNFYINDNIVEIDSKIKSLNELIESTQNELSKYEKIMDSVMANQSLDFYSKTWYSSVIEARDEMTDLIDNADQKASQKEYYEKTDKFSDFSENLTRRKLDEQNETYIKDFYNCLERINSYEDALEHLSKQKSALIEEQKKQVNDIIMDNNGNILGFDGYGRLILIQDSYENAITIEYEKNTINDKIVSIYSDSQKVTFEYNKSNNLLERIVTPKGSIITYTYNSDDLYEVFINKQTIQFNRVPSLNKIDIYDSLQNRLIIQFEDKIKQVIFEKSNKIVNANGTLTESGTTKTLLHHNYQFIPSKTLINNMSVVDNDSNSLDEIYYFDENDELITYKDKEGNILFKHFNEKELLEYQCAMKVKYSPYAEKASTLNQELEFTVGSSSSFDINSNLLEKTKVIGILIERTSDVSKSINIDIIAQNNTTNETKSYRFANSKLPWLIVPFIIPFKDMNKITVRISNTITENSTVKMVRLSSTFYTYDELERLILKENGYNSISYEEFTYDKPTLIKEIDEFGRPKNTVVRYDFKGNVIFTKDYLGNCKRYFYNEKNQLIEIMTYPNDEPTLVNIEKYQYDEKGNQIFEEDILPGTTLLKKNGSLTFGYDYDSSRLQEMACVANGVINKNQYKYNFDQLTKLTHDGMTYEYTYDSLGRILSVKIANTNKKLYSFAYNDNITYYQGTTKFDDAYEIIVTDVLENVVKSTYAKDGKILKLDNSVVVLNYYYNEDDQLTIIQDNNSNSLKHHFYNKKGQLDAKSTDNIMVYYKYDAFERLYKENLSLKSSTTSIINYTYVNSFSDLVKSMNIDDIVKIGYDYNSLHQVTKESIAINSNKILLSNEYYYLRQNENTTNLLTQLITKINDEYDDVINCEYDVNGNVISMTSKQNSVYYKYDELNRLVREDNLALDTTTLIQYDARGNILSKKEKYFHLDNIDLYKAELKQSYAYASKGWKDQLVSFNGNTITYDDCGRPITYKGKTLKWNHEGTLRSYGENQYSYNGFGIRTSKVTNLGTYNFIVDDSKILMMEINQKEIFTFRYFFDKLIGFNYNNNEYIYKRDILGNITHIIDSTGKVVAQYIYDAWGNHKVLDENGKESTDENSLGNLNPFRYKGYFYDVETQLFYCNSRYYSPELCRWISPDSIEYLDSESINGLNLYAYCGNDPINYADLSGHSAILLALLIGAIVGGIYGGVTAAANNQNILAGVLIGAGAGALMGAGAGVASLYLAPAIVGQAVVVGGVTYSAGAALAIGSGIAFGSGFIGGMAADALTQFVNDGGINDWGSVFVSGVQWGLINTASAFLGSLGGPVTTLDSVWLSGMFGSVTSAVGMTIDILRNRKNKKQKVGVNSQLYAYSF